MPKLIAQIVVYNSKTYLKQVFESVFAQTFQDFTVVAIICGNADGSKEFIQQNFPHVHILDPGQNLGFTGGHNLGFSQYDSEFVQLLSNDGILEPDYFKNLLAVFSKPSIAAATGKLYQYDFEKGEKQQTLDSTGVALYANGRARDRGQHEKDEGQYDHFTKVAAVSGALPMYRRAALNEVAEGECSGRKQIFDEAFFMGWEDVDVSLRLYHAGYTCAYVPTAVAYHVRGSGASPLGVKHFWSFLKHRKTTSQFGRKLNFQNHLFFIIKNFPRLGLGFIKREILMLGFIVLREITTLSIVPSMLAKLPSMLKKRKVILRRSKITPEEFTQLFTHSGNDLS